MTAEGIAKRLGIGIKQCQAKLRMLVREGLVSYTKQGRYYIYPNGTENLVKQHLAKYGGNRPGKPKIVPAADSMTVSEMARELNVARETVYFYLKKLNIQPIKYGQWPASALDAVKHQLTLYYRKPRKRISSRTPLTPIQRHNLIILHCAIEQARNYPDRDPLFIDNIIESIRAGNFDHAKVAVMKGGV